MNLSGYWKRRVGVWDSLHSKRGAPTACVKYSSCECHTPTVIPARLHYYSATTCRKNGGGGGGGGGGGWHIQKHIFKGECLSGHNLLKVRNPTVEKVGSKHLYAVLCVSHSKAMERQYSERGETTKESRHHFWRVLLSRITWLEDHMTCETTRVLSIPSAAYSSVRSSCNWQSIKTTNTSPWQSTSYYEFTVLFF